MPTKIALFGCGGFARNHARELIKRDDVEIGYLIDPNADNRNSLIDLLVEGGKPTPEVFNSSEEFFAANPDFDAADIVTPPKTHFEIARRLIEMGKPVYVEKPFTQTSDEARELARLSAEKNVEVEVGANRCVFLAYRAAGMAFKEGKVGQLESISMCTRYNWEELTRVNWRQDPEEPGSGALADHGPHNMHFLCTDLGFKPVKARHIGTRFNDRGVDVDISFQLQDQDGRSVLVVMDDSAPDNQRKETIQIHGSEGTIIIKLEGKTSIAYIEKNGQREQIDTSAAQAEIQSLGIENNRSHPALIHNFIGLITGKVEENANPAREGILPVQITELIGQSRGETKENTLTKAELEELSKMVDDGGRIDRERLEGFFNRGEEVLVENKQIDLEEIAPEGGDEISDGPRGPERL